MNKRDDDEKMVILFWKNWEESSTVQCLRERPLGFGMI
jgi:hypothetical protein